MFNDKKADPIRQRAKSEMGHIIRRQLEAMRSHEAERRVQEAERKEK